MHAVYYLLHIISERWHARRIQMKKMAVEYIETKIAHFRLGNTESCTSVHHCVKHERASSSCTIHQTPIIVQTIMRWSYRRIIFPTRCNTTVETISWRPCLAVVWIHNAIMMAVQGGVVKAIFFGPLSIWSTTRSSHSSVHGHFDTASTSCSSFCITWKGSNRQLQNYNNEMLGFLGWYLID